MIVQDLFGVAMSKHLTTWGSILFGDDEVYFNIRCPFSWASTKQ